MKRGKKVAFAVSACAVTYLALALAGCGQFDLASLAELGLGAIEAAPRADIGAGGVDAAPNGAPAGTGGATPNAGGFGGGGTNAADGFSGGATPAADAGEFGATQGGVQDMGLARELVEAGRVPPAEAFVVEGMFSEHDLGLAGDPCDRPLCLRGAVGIAPADDGRPSGWIQISMSSNIDPDNFERPSLSLIACVDVSGSMGWRYVAEDENDEFPTPGTLSRALLRALVNRLGPGDQIAIVTYGSAVNTALGMTPGDDTEAIQAVVEGLSEAGSTNMEAGLVRAYETARAVVGQADETRILLFTDVQPNVGMTTASGFEEMLDSGAGNDIGMTIFGMGLGLGQELLNGIAHVRGANAFSVFDYDDLAELMEDSWPWMVSPIAYDLAVEVTPGAGFSVADTYGFPAREEGAAPGFEVSTIFLSKSKGALLIRVTPDDGETLDGWASAATLGYESADGEPVEQRIDLAYGGQELDESGQYFEQPGVHKTVALALLTTSMGDAAEQYGTDSAAALETLETAINRFAEHVEVLDDEALGAELEFARQLVQLMREGAEQGDLYGSGLAD